MSQEELNIDVNKYRCMVYRLAFGCTGSAHDADDITQEVFWKLYNYKRIFNDDEHKKAFLLRITINLSKNLNKSMWYKKRTELEENMQVTHGFNETENVLREYVLQLNPKYRAVIHLFYYEGYSAAETAKLLKISTSAVTTRLNRARGILKTKLTSEKEALI